MTTPLVVAPASITSKYADTSRCEFWGCSLPPAVPSFLVQSTWQALLRCAHNPKANSLPHSLMLILSTNTPNQHQQTPLKHLSPSLQHKPWCLRAVIMGVGAGACRCCASRTGKQSSRPLPQNPSGTTPGTKHGGRV